MAALAGSGCSLLHMFFHLPSCAFVLSNDLSLRDRFKFDDELVTPCSEFAAIEDNYGGIAFLTLLPHSVSPDAGSDLGIWNYFDRRPRELPAPMCFRLKGKLPQHPHTVVTGASPLVQK